MSEAKPPGASVPAAEDVPAFRAVAVVGGVGYLADPTNPDHAGKVRGVSVLPASAGANVCMQLAGPMVGPWSFEAGGNVFVGLDGQLVQEQADGATWVTVLGQADTDTAFWLSLHQLAISIEQG